MIKKYEEEFDTLKTKLTAEGILTSALVIPSDDFLKGAETVTHTTRGLLFPPNILFIKLGQTDRKDQIINELVVKTKTPDLGVILVKLHPQHGLGKQKVINLWIIFNPLLLPF